MYMLQPCFPDMLRGNPFSSLLDQTMAALFGVVFPFGGIVLELDSVRGTCGLFGCVVSRKAMRVYGFWVRFLS